MNPKTHNDNPHDPEGRSAASQASAALEAHDFVSRAPELQVAFATHPHGQVLRALFVVILAADLLGVRPWQIPAIEWAATLPAAVRHHIDADRLVDLTDDARAHAVARLRAMFDLVAMTNWLQLAEEDLQDQSDDDRNRWLLAGALFVRSDTAQDPAARAAFAAEAARATARACVRGLRGLLTGIIDGPAYTPAIPRSLEGLRPDAAEVTYQAAGRQRDPRLCDPDADGAAALMGDRDAGARSGHRSATSPRGGGTSVGYDLHVIRSYSGSVVRAELVPLWGGPRRRGGGGALPASSTATGRGGGVEVGLDVRSGRDDRLHVHAFDGPVSVCGNGDGVLPADPDGHPCVRCADGVEAAVGLLADDGQVAASGLRIGGVAVHVDAIASFGGGIAIVAAADHHDGGGGGR